MKAATVLLRTYVKVRPGTIEEDALFKVGEMMVGTLAADWVNWLPLDGRVLRVGDYPELFSYLGHDWDRPRENWLQRLARRVFRIPYDLREDEFRIPREPGF
jgi:hypothetical protein